MALCLAGKILSPDLVNIDTFRSLIARIWKLKGGVEIEVVTNNVYAFHFQLPEDRRKVFVGGPWTFDDSLIVLEEPIRKGSIKGLKFDKVEFWVQISNLPLLCMTKEIAQFIGDIIGEVREVDTSPTRDCLGKFVRVRVAVDITKPLRRFLRVDVLGDGEETMRAMNHGKNVGNREWNLQYTIQRPKNFGEGSKNQVVAVVDRMMPGKKLGGDFSRRIAADKSGRVDRGMSISNSKCDLVGDSGRDSGDRNLIRKENLGGRSVEFVTEKESYNAEMETGVSNLLTMGRAYSLFLGQVLRQRGLVDQMI
ncbi:hypothetical protein EZV62_023656 [Acer yangbiense]|uniref:DUF4283 domain-containing protein n=1 Tax=Acer yangbiense TaxID=1000413 RepID=A0A5C7H3S4_9ROSI|nr:hypothetical protein EZV62_023656 [Acer yangbiense]